MAKPTTSGKRQVIFLLGALVLIGQKILLLRKYSQEIHDTFCVATCNSKIIRKSHIPKTPLYQEGATILSQDSVVYRYPTDSFKQFMISNGPGVIVGVLSAASSQDKRESIRNTWAFNRSTVFFLVAGNWSDVKNEFAEKHDLFWIDKDESYHGVNFKVQAFIAAVERHVPHFRHLLKTNDDSYVRLAPVEKLSAKDQNADYWGFCIKGNVEGHGRFASKEESREDAYPSNAQGAEYLLSQRLVKCLANVKGTKQFNVEDARACSVACTGFGSRLHDASKGPPSEFSLISHQVKTTEAMTELHSLSCHHAEADVISCASGCWTSPIDAIFPKGEEAKRLCDSKTLAEFQTDPYWARYRFSDYFKGLHVPRITRRWKKNWAAYDPGYPGSLFDEYHRQSILDGVSKLDMNVLHRIVQRRVRKAAETPPPNSLVIHLRLGDVIDAANETVPELLRTQHYFYRNSSTGEEFKKRWNAYVRPLAHFSKLPFKKDVIIMGAAHYGESDLRGNVTKSCLYTRAIQKYFEMRGAKVTLRLGRPPDDDIVYGSQSKWYAQAGGGYSTVIGNLVNYSGGHVFK